MKVFALQASPARKIESPRKSNRMGGILTTSALLVRVDFSNHRTETVDREGGEQKVSKKERS